MHYVIGDVHSCLDELNTLLGRIEEKDPAAEFIFVGDFADRGPRYLDTIRWCKEHIRPTGKYRTVIGNHEDLLLQWFPGFRDWWENQDRKAELRRGIPQTQYNFSRMIQEEKKADLSFVESVMNLIREWPSEISVTVPGKNRNVTYRIAHAWPSAQSSDEEERRNCNIWNREDEYVGNFANDDIYIHGHTPTISDYDNGRLVPGMIGYRRHAINVDGGCVFSYNPEFGKRYVCMLCAICLETLEEIYPWSVLERIAFLHPGEPASRIEKMYVEIRKKRKEYLCNPYRSEMLKMLGVE